MTTDTEPVAAVVPAAKQCAYYQKDDTKPTFGMLVASYKGPTGAWRCANAEHPVGADGQDGHARPANASGTGPWVKG